jgi:hypothetical protein
MKMTKNFKVEKNERGFYFIEIHHDIHSREIFRLWIHPYFIHKDEEGKEYVEFPLENAKIEITEKGSFVLRRKQGWIVWVIEWRSGYRGSANVEVLGDGVEVIKKIKVLHSPLGNLGETELVFFNIPQNVKAKVICKRTGRHVSEEERKGIEYEVCGKEIYEVRDDVEKFLKEEE